MSVPHEASDALRERETNVLMNDAEDTATVYTAQPVLMRRLQRNPLAIPLETHRDGRGRVTGMEFRIPKRAVRIMAVLPRRGIASPAGLEVLKAGRTTRRLGQSGHPGATLGGTRGA